MKQLVPINLLRKRAGLSVAEFARVAGVSWKSAKHWDCGRRAPSLSNLATIISALGKLGIKADISDFVAKPTRRAA